MLKTIKDILFSTRLTAVLLFVFGAAIGVATFIENDFGTPASKAVIFNTRWLELVMLLLTINLIGNIFKYKMIQLSKLATLTFHVALIIILIGAGITRYISYEGLMHIREGETSNTIVSDDTFLQFKVDNQEIQTSYEKKLFLNPLYNAPFNIDFDFVGSDVEVTFKDFIQNSIDTVLPDDNGKNIIEIVTVGQKGRVSRFIEQGQTKFFGNFPVAFDNNTVAEAVKIMSTDTGLIMVSPYDVNYLSMDDQSTGLLKKDTIHIFKNRRLYSIGQVQMVYKQVHEKSVIKQVSADKKNPNGEDALIVDVTCNGKSKEVILFGGKGYLSNPTIFQLEGLNFSLTYGAKQTTVPFEITLDDFILDKYPGSMSPSSYESEVTLNDNRNGGVKFSQKIFMNNVLDYDGYRFFQSSYDQDELGTVLSVNHDFWGTTITYIGYFLLALGMVITLITKNSRFNTLRRKVKEIRMKREAMTVLVALFSIAGLQAQDTNNHKVESTEFVVVNKEHADKFGRLLVQDADGRIKPVQTMASEMLRKVTRKEMFNDMNPSQVLLSMMYNPPYWQTLPLIKVNHPELEEKLGAVDHYAPFLNFFDKNFQYIIQEDAAIANRKKPSERTKYDKEVIAVDERANVCFMVFDGSLFKIFPKFGDENNTWFTSKDYQKFTSHDSVFVKAMLPYYFSVVSESFKTNNWATADSILTLVADYQYKFGAEVIPEQSKIDLEITYNKVNIFKRLFMYYTFVGLLMLVFLFADIFSAKKWKKTVVKFLTGGLFILFGLHTLGLAARWYISGHAPWSNGYESMIYIGWATVFAGFLFSRTSKMTLAATSILTALILMVAHLNWLDPEITPLVPVLKSYWLMIHVAIITGSYGFLGLGCLLGFMNLILMIVKTAKNRLRINSTIKELTIIVEMTLTVGLFMAAVGTFLGGVWANESWGRYWGWDPKETWALVIVLIYAMILHLRFIPKANGKFLFNMVSVLGFSVVIMTYFGVNYYLAGLHSYAKGDPVPIPTFVPVTLVVVLLVGLAAYLRNRKDRV
jgi:cytochrome c-type biogenesis protein CcsB